MKLVAILLACTLTAATGAQPPPTNAHTNSPSGPPSPTAILFCSADAQQYCSAESASVTTEAAVLKLLKCFNVHETSLSPACQRALAPLPEYQCASDVMALCSTAVSSGRRAVADCLQKNSQDVSATCTAAMQQPHRQRGHDGHQAGRSAPNGSPSQSPDDDGQRRGSHGQHGRRHGQHGGHGGRRGHGGHQGAPPNAQPNQSPDDDNEHHHHGPHHGHHHPPGGLIVLGGLVAVAIVGFVVWRVRKRRRARVAAQREAVGMQQASAPPQVVVATGQPTGVQASPVTYTSGITSNGYARLNEQQV